MIQDGCWFCGGVKGELHFSVSFDCPVHKECLITILQGNPEHDEALFMADEFGLEKCKIAVSPEAGGVHK